jgi:molybdopterin molybdotransferase
MTRLRAEVDAVIDVGDALHKLLDEVKILGTEEVGLDDALGRVLGEDVVADRDFPPTDRSAMDGYAVRSADLTEPDLVLRIQGELRAGAPLGDTRLEAGEAIRIFTGGIVPPGADAVVMVEVTTEDETTESVRIGEVPEPGQHIRRRGEDIKKGDTIVGAGILVRPAEIAALATVGKTRVTVHVRPVVNILSTGDEVVEPGETPGDHQVRNSNARALLAQLAELGIEGRYLGIVGDTPEQLDAALAKALDADVLLITGGVSVGEYDLVGDELARAGMRFVFHKVNMRPGKPILVGKRDGCLVVGLPGNPLSTFTGFAVLVGPALRRMMGHASFENVEVLLPLAATLRRKPGRTTYHLAHVAPVDGELRVHPVKSMSSGDVLSLVRANAFVVTLGSPHAIEPGTKVPVLLWRAPMGPWA